MPTGTPGSIRPRATPDNDSSERLGVAVRCLPVSGVADAASETGTAVDAGLPGNTPASFDCGLQPDAATTIAHRPMQNHFNARESLPNPWPDQAGAPAREQTAARTIELQAYGGAASPREYRVVRQTEDSAADERYQAETGQPPQLVR